MSAAEESGGLLGEYLNLFAHTEIFVFVFMEIVTKLAPIQRVIFKKALLRDYIGFVTIFGLFSIFGTYIGSAGDYGIITNIRDLAPMVAGLIAGPLPGLAAGLIGGVHRYTLGGATSIPCSLATILAGLLAGLVHRLNKGRLLDIIPAMIFALAIEFLHLGLGLVLSPAPEVVKALLASMPQIMIAVTLGMGICVVIIHTTKEESGDRTPAEPPPPIPESRPDRECDGGTRSAIAVVDAPAADGVLRLVASEDRPNRG
jgi:LytS/YehU family sensor histidine kinase